MSPNVHPLSSLFKPFYSLLVVPQPTPSRIPPFQSAHIHVTLLFYGLSLNTNTCLKIPRLCFLLASAILIWHFHFSFSSFSHLYMYLPHSRYRFLTSFATRVKKKTYHVSWSCCYLFCIQLNISWNFFILLSFIQPIPFFLSGCGKKTYL